MASRSKPSDPAGEVLEDGVIARLAESVAPVELTSAERASMHERMLGRIQDEAPPGTFTVRAADMQWVRVGEGVEVKVLRVDRERNDQTVLIRMQAGAVVVGHRHTQEEECLVLEGEVLVGGFRLGQGDMHVAKPGARHPPITAPRGALLLIRSELPPPQFRIA